MGEVYLAQDTQLRRPVAIKILTTDFTHDTDRLHRFEHESYAGKEPNKNTSN
jgi:serine/threonine protein kinase